MRDFSDRTMMAGAVRDARRASVGAPRGAAVHGPRAPLPDRVRRQRAHRLLDLADVLRRRPAAPADEADPVGDEAARVRRHVLGRAEIDVAAFDLARLSGVRLRRQLDRRDAREPLDRFEHRRRTDAAVQPDDVGAPALELGHEGLRRRAVARVAVLLGRHLRDDRQVADRADGANRGADLVDVAEGLEHEEVDAALEERARLFGEVLLRLVDAGLPPRLDADPERTDRAGDPGLILRGVARDARALDVDGVHLVGQAEVTQLDAVGAEGVRLDDVGAVAHVGLVDLGDQVGLREVQLVEASG